jgi:hypothetical protein
MILKAIDLAENWPPIWMTDVDDPCISCNNFCASSSFTHHSSKPSVDLLNKEFHKMIYLEYSRKSLLL